MPDRKMRGSAWYGAAYLAGAAAGAVGVLYAPSSSVATFFDGKARWALFLWSGMLLVAALAAYVSRMRMRYYAETVAVEVMSGIFGAWAVIVFFVGSSSSVQAGFGFATAAMFMHGWARGRRVRVLHALAQQAAKETAARETPGDS